jgi:molybdenum cofactor biosynthesis protein B
VSAAEHRAAARDLRARCGILTTSDTRSLATDASGSLIADRLREAGHTVGAHLLTPDDRNAIEDALDALLGTCEIVVTTGGTGLSARDVTADAVAGRIETPLPGFGETFRMLSFDEVGVAGMLSRAVAGRVGRAFVFALPGSTGAVALAMDRLIVPVLPHLLRELRR